MLKFDEQRLLGMLSILPVELRTTFAAACTQRLMPCYEAFAKKVFFNQETEQFWVPNTLKRLWKVLYEEQKLPNKEIPDLIKHTDELVPDGDQTWKVGELYAQDAVAALVYTLEVRLTGSLQNAIFCAQCPYDALDNYVINKFSLDPVKDGEKTILAHPLIQQEFSRQLRDLEELHRALKGPNPKATIKKIHQRAILESLDFLVSCRFE